MFFYGNEVKPTAAVRVLAPRLPGGEEVQPLPEAGFHDHELVAPGPVAGQAITAQKHVMGLRQPPFRAVVDVVVTWRKRNAVGGDDRLGGLEGTRHGRHWRTGHFGRQQPQERAVKRASGGGGW
ncbi:hypothetical protein D3C87_1181440 [compost metagenome]